MAVSIPDVELYDLTTTEDPLYSGFYYVSYRVKAFIQTTSAICSISEASVCICDAGGCLDGPYQMNPDPSLGPNWYSAGVLTSWGAFGPGDHIKAHVDASEQCWSEDSGSGDSTPVSVPDSLGVPPGPPTHPGPRALMKKKAARMAFVAGQAVPRKKKKKKPKKKKKNQ